MLPQSLVFHSYFTINQQIVNLTCFCLWFLHKTRLIGYILPKKTIDSRYYTDIVPSWIFIYKIHGFINNQKGIQ